MATTPPLPWSSTSEYSLDDTANFSGAVYVCVAADGIPQNSEGNNIPFDNPDWKFKFVININSYYSMQEAVKLAINTNDDSINSSIPLFIQTAEQALNKVLRSPAQIITQVFAVDSDSKFAIPDDVVEIVHMRRNKDAPTGYSLETRGIISIECAVDKQQYENIRLNYQSNWRSTYLAGQADYPVYWNDGQHFWLAPVLEAGEEIELSYYREVPRLGTFAFPLNRQFEQLNKTKQTIEEWVEEGNDPDYFIPSEEYVISNLWTDTIPQLVRLGALISAESYLSNYQMMPVWKENYAKTLAETINSYTTFDSQRQRSQTMQSGYFA